MWLVIGTGDDSCKTREVLSLFVSMALGDSATNFHDRSR